ncbi:MAG: cob(I)yrinic acid a,c-diamide adenosyltransferase [Chloroflexi bacterium]|nr:cob(I)yrinic acid a,c-diamide adenosyltransferase [Chloroflexota bacterium]
MSTPVAPPTDPATVEPIHPALTDTARAEQAATVRAQQRRPDRRAKGLVIVHTGDGKGKTTAALGLLLRAWGRDLRVVMLQFIKAKGARWGEVQAARRLGIEIIPLGAGFTWDSANIAVDRALAQAGWAECRQRIESGAYDIVILDEITYCFTYGWLDLDEVLAVLRRRPSAQHVVLTGRDAPEPLIAFADLATEMREIKHPYHQGVKAQKGIEF